MLSIVLVFVLLFLLSASVRTEGHLSFACLFAALVVAVLTIDQLGFSVDLSLYAVLGVLFASWLLIVSIKRFCGEIDAARDGDIRVTRELRELPQETRD